MMMTALNARIGSAEMGMFTKPRNSVTMAWMETILMNALTPAKNQLAGDGHKWEGNEDCDDGDNDNDDNCLFNCKVATCGDKFVNTVGGEECDDGNDINTDSCTNKCK